MEKARQQYIGQRFEYCFALMRQFIDSIHHSNITPGLSDIVLGLYSPIHLERFFSVVENNVTACGEACDLERAQRLVYYEQPVIRWFALVALQHYH